jgi:hypothetical protein
MIRQTPLERGATPNDTGQQWQQQQQQQHSRDHLHSDDDSHGDGSGKRGGSSSYELLPLAPGFQPTDVSSFLKKWNRRKRLRSWLTNN